MATSDRRVAERAHRYFVSRKHLAGTAGGLAGVALSLSGVAGPLWPVVVVALYAAAALAAPSDRPPGDYVRQLLASSAEEAAALVEELDRIRRCVRDAEAELPAGVPDRVDEIERKLAGMLAHPNVLADPDVLHVMSTTIRKDLDRIVATYLALPSHLRDRPIPSGDRTPADELARQLCLLDDYVSVTSERIFSSQTRDIAHLGDYLERRNQQERSALESGE